MRAGTHVTLPYYWDMRSAGTYNTHHFSFHLHGWHNTPMNHTHEHTHVSCHDYSHSFHHKTYSFPLAVNPVNCYVVCYIDSLICFCRFELFFLYLSVTVLSLAYLFLLCLYSDSFSLCLVLHVQVTLPSISLVVIIVSAQNGSMSCQTHALHCCMLISHGLLYMVMSKGLHVTDVDVFHTCNWIVCCMYWTGVSGIGSTGVVGANFLVSSIKHSERCP